MLHRVTEDLVGCAGEKQSETRARGQQVPPFCPGGFRFWKQTDDKFQGKHAREKGEHFERNSRRLPEEKTSQDLSAT